MGARHDRELAQPSSAAAAQAQLFPVEQLSPYQAVERSKEQARGLAESTPPGLRFACAQSFCAAVIHRYWIGIHGRRGPAFPEAPGVRKSLKRDAEVIAFALADGAVGLTVEEAAYLIGSTYAAMLPTEFRSDNGVYYTPPALVRRLLDAATTAGVDWSNCRVLDPACGGGAFLGPVAARMVGAMKNCDRRVVLRNVAQRLRGLEIDPFAAWMSQVFLQITLHDLIGGSVEIGSLITVGDALASDDRADFDLVIGNPPYGRVSLGREQRERYRRSLFGHANLYGMFLDFAARKASAGGLVAYVTPTSFLSGEYYKRLRGLLAAEAAPVSLDFVSEREGVFDDVLQETLLAVYRRGAKASKLQVNFVEVNGSSLSVTSAGAVALPEAAESPWIIPRSPGAIALAKRVSALPSRLADWGYGVSTGPLVWNRYKDQLCHKHERGTVPLIWAESVSADGTFSFRAARRNHAPYFAPKKGEDDWLLVSRPCVLLQRTTAKEQARRLIAAELPSTILKEHDAVTVENHLNMIVAIVDDPPVDTGALAAFLNSTVADQVFRCINGSVAVSAYELEAMPLPSPAVMAELAALLKRRASRLEVEALCERLYRL